MSGTEEINEHVAIEKEKQKTLRYLIFFGTFIIIAIIGLYFVFVRGSEGGKKHVEFDLSKGQLKFSVEKPLVEQIDQPTLKYTAKNQNVNFTTGQIKQEVVDEISQNVNVESDQFTGKNLINTQAGYIMSVENPGNWQVSYDSEGLYDASYPINTIYSNNEYDGHVNINLYKMMPGEEFKSSLESGMQELVYSGSLQYMPVIEYDEAGTTAFLQYYNDLGGASAQKIVKRGNRAYIATANYNENLTPENKINELVDMVASFTPISSN